MEDMKNIAITILEGRLQKIISILEDIEKLANDSWNVDDTVCQQNMKKIKELLAVEIS